MAVCFSMGVEEHHPAELKMSLHDGETAQWLSGKDAAPRMARCRTGLRSSKLPQLVVILVRKLVYRYNKVTSSTDE